VKHFIENYDSLVDGLLTLSNLLHDIPYLNDPQEILFEEGVIQSGKVGADRWVRGEIVIGILQDLLEISQFRFWYAFIVLVTVFLDGADPVLRHLVGTRQ